METHLRPCLGLAWLGETENKPKISKGEHAICVVATDDFLNTANTSKQKNYTATQDSNTLRESQFFDSGGMYVPTYHMVRYMSVPLFSSCMLYNTHTHEPDMKSEESQQEKRVHFLRAYHNRTLMLSHRVLAEQHS